MNILLLLFFIFTINITNGGEKSSHIKDINFLFSNYEQRKAKQIIRELKYTSRKRSLTYSERRKLTRYKKYVK